MKEQFFGIRFGTFENIIYFVFLIFFLTIIVYKLIKIKRVSKILSNVQKNILINYSNSKNILKAFLLLLGSFFLFFSLLSPQWNKKDENIKQEGRDIYIALDISRSMLATDFFPTRLEWAKAKVKSLLKLLKTDRIGLVLFSGAAFVQCPLTKDFNAFNMFLDQADAKMISSGTTSIEQAISLVLNKFKSDNARRSKLLIIFTDGEDFSSNLAGIKEEACKQGLSIFTIGSATHEGAPVPLFDNDGIKIGHQLNENGSAVISQLNEGILKALSQSCGGVYIQGGNDDNDIKCVINKVEKFEKEKFNEFKFSYLEEQYPYFISISLLCLALEWIL